ncbi:MAG: hypothetical protein K2X27_15615 [Candidatus Obscuribacterales bacterium]|nr:hypothetical protein [Candidatus Obscuribacterales bacterium]
MPYANKKTNIHRIWYVFSWLSLFAILIGIWIVSMQHELSAYTSVYNWLWRHLALVPLAPLSLAFLSIGRLSAPQAKKSRFKLIWLGLLIISLILAMATDLFVIWGSI